MIRGLYTGASGMMMEMVNHDAISNNLANINTTGYKRDIPIFKDFSKMMLQRINEEPKVISPRFTIGRDIPVGTLGTGVTTDALRVDFAEGGYMKTDNTLDLAIKGDGFFAVETEDGIRYTRDGSFNLNKDGELCNHDGYQVLGVNGPISIQGSNVNIDEDGNVVVDNVEVDRIQVIDFENRVALRKVGQNLFAAPYDAPVLSGTGKVIQGSLEKANVELSQEMVRMITALRSYEINQKGVQAQDEMLDKAINQVGRVA